MARILLLWAGLLAAVHSEQECSTADDSSLLQVKSHVASAESEKPKPKPDDENPATMVMSGNIMDPDHDHCKDVPRSVISTDEDGAKCKKQCLRQGCQFYSVNSKPTDGTSTSSICTVCKDFGEGSRFKKNKDWETYAMCSGDDCVATATRIFTAGSEE